MPRALCSDLKLCTISGTMAYSGIFNNNSYNKNINSLFCTLILHNFQQNLKRHMLFDYNDYVIFENSVKVE